MSIDSSPVFNAWHSEHVLCLTRLTWDITLLRCPSYKNVIDLHACLHRLSVSCHDSDFFAYSCGLARWVGALTVDQVGTVAHWSLVVVELYGLYGGTWLVILSLACLRGTSLMTILGTDMNGILSYLDTKIDCYF